MASFFSVTVAEVDVLQWNGMASMISLLVGWQLKHGGSKPALDTMSAVETSK